MSQLPESEGSKLEIDPNTSRINLDYSGNNLVEITVEYGDAGKRVVLVHKEPRRSMQLYDAGLLLSHANMQVNKGDNTKVKFTGYMKNASHQIVQIMDTVMDMSDYDQMIEKASTL